MVTLNEQIDIQAPYERMEEWVDHFEEEFVKWSPYHIECELYDGGYQTGMKVRFREIVGGLDYNVTGYITACERDEDHFRIVFQSEKKSSCITFEGKRTDTGCHFSHTEAFGLTTPILGPILTACAIAAEEIGAEKAGRAARAAQRRYEELLSENRNDSKALRPHTFHRIYPAIALYESLRAEGVASEKAVWYIREYFQWFSTRTVPHLQRLIKVLGLARWVPKLFMRLSQKSFGTDAGFEYEFPESHDNEARFDIVRCPYYETCRRYGCPEITTAFCDGDDAGYGHLHPRLLWGRTKTIGRGDPCCDFLLRYTSK